MIITGMDEEYDVHIYCRDCPNLSPSCEVLSLRVVEKETSNVIYAMPYQKSGDIAEDYQFYQNELIPRAKIWRQEYRAFYV